ncbi:hypothetical protein AB6806_09100 [Bosea sp. RCC_152_1]|uniref:hypothetical protein n=1 Tax=Bosea sp. RCC_152_1 TaxID=3239228 RepID=UPI0035245F63
MTLDKAEIARRQLGSALALFLEDLDPVSVHSLACGGGEIAEHLSRSAGANPFSAHMLEAFPDSSLADIKRLRNQFWNAFKHASSRTGQNRQDEELLDRFDDGVNDHALLLGWHDYMQATQCLPIEVQIFFIWYYAMYPDKLDGSAQSNGVSVREYSLDLFSKLAEVPREEAKRRLRVVIEHRQRTDPELMSHPQTERRPLIAPRGTL